MKIVTRITLARPVDRNATVNEVHAVIAGHAAISPALAEMTANVAKLPIEDQDRDATSVGAERRKETGHRRCRCRRSLSLSCPMTGVSSHWRAKSK